MSTRPDVSIIIPVHNRVELLRAAVNSCSRSAPSLALQVIVIDDASTENVAALSGTLPIEFERLPVNSGSSVARNRGLQLARGRFVKFLDSDDVLVPGALAHEHQYALATGADIVVSGWCDTRLDDGGRDEVLARFAAPRFGRVVDDLLAGQAAPTSSALYTAEIAARVQWDAKLSKLNDWDFFISAALQARRIESVEGCAYLWRQHSGSRITSSSSFVGNALEFYAILGKLESHLQEGGLLTQPRRRRLAQYLYKELRGLYRFRRDERHAIVRKILELDPAFRPSDEESSSALRALARVLPLRWVLGAYGLLRSTMDRAAAEASP